MPVYLLGQFIEASVLVGIAEQLPGVLIGSSVKFAQFLPELAKAIIPLGVSVHFFSAPVIE
jgi:hypothetical protein